MPNIVLTRIDNRLVHGQVATQWCGSIGANLILVANDEVAGNSSFYPYHPVHFTLSIYPNHPTALISQLCP